MDNKNTYRVWLRETAYYAVDVQADSREAAIDAAEHPFTTLPKPYEYSPIVATKAQLIRAIPHISKKREDMLKRRGFRNAP